ncbi:MAG: metalloregulator ArsR/SmtB family transcription factor [Nanoarchaeota archaeon]
MNQKLKSCCSENKIEGDELIGAYKIFFGTMASEPRLKILNLLRKKKMNVSEIMEETGMEQGFVSHNLARLKKCGFVEIENEGKFRVYKLNEKTIKPLLTLIDEHMAQNCVHILRGEIDG